MADNGRTRSADLHAYAIELRGHGKFAEMRSSGGVTARFREFPMRNLVYGAILGMLAVTSVASAQPVTLPQPQVESAPTDSRPQAYRALVTTDAIPPVIPGPPPGYQPTPGEFAAEGGPPGYPPPGPYGQQMYETPRLEGGLFDGVRSTPRIWFDGQYLLLFPREQPLTTPLVTTSAPADAGVVGRGTTTSLFGGRNLTYDPTSGFRLSGGMFHPRKTRLGIEFGGLYMSPVSSNFEAFSSQNGIPLFARPFFDTSTNTDSSLLASFPTFIYGRIIARQTTKFWGAELSGLLNLYRTPPETIRAYSFNLLGGMRYLELTEGLNVSSSSSIIGDFTVPFGGITLPSPSTVFVQDDFVTRNRFYGGQVGFQSQYFGGRWYAGVTGKAAFGMVNQRLTISGASGYINPGTNSDIPENTPAAANTTNGLYANTANIGRYIRDEFGIVTDVNATIGLNLTSWLTITAGYNFVHLNTVLRPGLQISNRVDTTTIPTSNNFGGAPGARELVILRPTDYFVHGLNFGFIGRY